MTHWKTLTAKTSQIVTADAFKLAYHSTIRNLCGSEYTTPTNAPLQILHLILECPRNNISYTLELWLFCEARRIFNSTVGGLYQDAIRKRIVQRFAMQLIPEKRSQKVAYIQQLIFNILQKMGFMS